MESFGISHPNVTSSEQIGEGERVQEASSIKTQNKTMQQNVKQFYGLYQSEAWVTLFLFI